MCDLFDKSNDLSHSIFFLLDLSQVYNCKKIFCLNTMESQSSQIDQELNPPNLL